MEIIRFECGCGNRIKVAPQFAGKQGTCPACGVGFVVPNPSMASGQQPMVVPTEDVPVLHSDKDDLDGLSNADIKRPPEWRAHPANAGSEPRSSLKSPTPLANIPAVTSSPARQPPAPPNAHVDPSNKPKPASIPFMRLLGKAVGGSLSGWIATVIFGIVWLVISENGKPQSVTLFISSGVVCFVIAYLLAAPVRRLVDGILAKIRTGLKLPAIRLLVICGLSLLITVLPVVGRIKHGAEAARLIASAKEAHLQGDLEKALKFLDEIKYRNGDEWNWSEARDLQSQYETEFGKQQEPEVARVVAAAKTAIASGDRTKGVSLLKQATNSTLKNAPSYVEANELLKTIGFDTEPAVSSRSGFANGSGLARKGFGKSLADLTKAMPFLGLNGPFTKTVASDGESNYKWVDGNTFIIDLHGTDANIDSLLISSVILLNGRTETNTARWIMAISAIRAASGDENTDEITLMKSLMDAASGQGPPTLHYGQTTVSVRMTAAKAGRCFVFIDVKP